IVYTPQHGMDAVPPVDATPGPFGWKVRSMSSVTQRRGVPQAIRSLSGMERADYVDVFTVATKAAADASPEQTTIRRIFVGNRASLEAMNRAIATARLRPVIDRVFGFDEAPEAYRYFMQGKVFGTVVVRGTAT